MVQKCKFILKLNLQGRTQRIKFKIQITKKNYKAENIGKDTLNILQSTASKQLNCLRQYC